MSTLGTLKSEISDDLARTDLSTQIAAAITAAINHYKARRLYFNETRSATWVTVAAQSDYTSADDADIPLFLKLDDVFLEDSDSRSFRLTRADPVDLEIWLDSDAPSDQPYAYAYINRTFRLYPIPDAVYTIRPVGHIELAAPAADDTADNAWMTEAYELLRCRAKWFLYLHVIKKPDMAELMHMAEMEALSKLGGATTDRVASGTIRKTSW